MVKLMLMIIVACLVVCSCNINNTEQNTRHDDEDSDNISNTDVGKNKRKGLWVRNPYDILDDLAIYYVDLKEEAKQITSYDFDMANLELMALIQGSTLYDNKKSSVLLTENTLHPSKYIVSLKNLGIITINKNECNIEGYIIKYDTDYWNNKKLEGGSMVCWQRIYLDESEYIGYGDYKVMDKINNPEEIIYNMYVNINTHIKESDY